jgi:hypothetical protein
LKIIIIKKLKTKKIAIKNTKTKLDIKNKWIKYQNIKLKKKSTFKSIKSKTNSN